MASNTVGARLPLFALVAANAVSLLGNTVAAVAIPWFVLVTTGSAARTGVAAFFTTLPLALGALFGGAVADRIGARTTSVIADLAGGAAIAGIPLLHALGELEFWHVLAAGFLGGLFDAPGQAAREALLPELADRAGLARDRANSLWAATEHGGYVLGAPLAGLLIAVLGAPAALWLDAASFTVSASAVALGVPGLPLARVREAYLQGFVRGLRFVAANGALRTFFVLATIGNFLVAPLAPVLLPVYAREELGGSGSLGVLIGAYGAGGLAGAAGYGLVARRLDPRTVFVVIWLGYAPAWAVLIAVPPFAAAAVVLFLIGMIAGAIAPIEQRVRQDHTPPELRGRVFATLMASLVVVVPPAVLLAGLAVEAVGLRGVFLALTLANALLTVAALACAPRYLGSARRATARSSVASGAPPLSR